MALHGGIEDLASAGAGLGIPQAGAVPGGDAGGLGGIEELLAQLTSGQLGPEMLLQLLALLTGGGGLGGPPGLGAAPAPPGDPIAAALAGGGGAPPGLGGGGLPPELGGGLPPGLI